MSLARAAMMEGARRLTLKRYEEVRQQTGDPTSYAGQFLALAECVIRYLDALEFAQSYPFPSPPESVVQHLKQAEDNLRACVGWPRRNTSETQLGGQE